MTCYRKLCKRHPSSYAIVPQCNLSCTQDLVAVQSLCDLAMQKLAGLAQIRRKCWLTGGLLHGVLILAWGGEYNHDVSYTIIHSIHVLA